MPALSPAAKDKAGHGEGREGREGGEEGREGRKGGREGGKAYLAVVAVDGGEEVEEGHGFGQVLHAFDHHAHPPRPG